MHLWGISLYIYKKQKEVNVGDNNEKDNTVLTAQGARVHQISCKNQELCGESERGKCPMRPNKPLPTAGI
jgi:hypothetical protein